MNLVNITLAKAQLSSLLRQVEEKGEQIIIGRAGRPIARIVKYQGTKTINRLGVLKGEIQVLEDFDNWSEEFAIKFGIRD